MQIVGEFDAHGWHRTGTPADDATTGWLVEQLETVGVSAEALAFHFPKVEIECAQIMVADAIIRGHPQFDAGFTPADGVRAPLALTSGEVQGRIEIVDTTFDGGVPSVLELEAAVERCELHGSLGAVVVARSAGSMILPNAHRINNPGRLPTLHVRPADAAPLFLAAGRGDTAVLTITATRRRARADNVLGLLPADAPSHAAPVVVLTPKSGWFHCTAERGCGIAVWLAVARGLVGHPGRRRDVVFVATSGHELGYMGIEDLLQRRPELAKAHTWIHLGASIGAAINPTLGLRASDETLRQLAVGALERTAAPPLNLLPAGAAPVGEAETVAKLGGRYISLAGGHSFFHTPEDRPDKVSGEATAQYAAAVLDLARSLACGEG